MVPTFIEKYKIEHPQNLYNPTQNEYLYNQCTSATQESTDNPGATEESNNNQKKVKITPGNVHDFRTDYMNTPSWEKGFREHLENNDPSINKEEATPNTNSHRNTSSTLDKHSRHGNNQEDSYDSNDDVSYESVTPKRKRKNKYKPSSGDKSFFDNNIQRLRLREYSIIQKEW